MTDVYTYGYQGLTKNDRALNELVYQSMDSSDARKSQFFTPEALGPDYQFMQASKFTMVDESGEKIFGNNQGKSGISEDYIFMRCSEVILLLTEAHAQMGNAPKVASTIEPLIRKRLGKSEADALLSSIPNMSQDELKTFVFSEWRKEFWAEGKVYFAMKRLKQSVTRDAHNLYLANQTLSHSDSRFVLPTGIGI